MAVFIVLVWSLAFSVQEKDLAKDMMICEDVSMSAYKTRHPDETDGPPDIGLSFDDEATGVEVQIGIAWWITVPHPERSVSPSYSQGRAAAPADDQAPSTSASGPSGEPPAGFVRLALNEVVIRKAVLHGIKRGAKLDLQGKLPTSFSAGSASAGDMPFAVLKPGKDEVHCTFCRKDFPSAKFSGGTCVKTMREHRAMHRGPFPCPVEDCLATFSLPKHCNHHLREKRGFDSRRN